MTEQQLKKGKALEEAIEDIQRKIIIIENKKEEYASISLQYTFSEHHQIKLKKYQNKLQAEETRHDDMMLRIYKNYLAHLKFIFKYL